MPTDPTAGDPATTSRCVVLAGGRGVRLGGKKAGVRLGGRALIDYPIAAAEAAGLTVLVVAKPGTDLTGTAAEGAGVEIVREPREPTHPLLGLATALEHAGEPVVVSPCDQPLLPSALLARLARAPGPVVVAWDGGVEPLLGRYEPTAAARLRAAAAAGRSAQALVAALGPQLLEAPELLAFGDPTRFLRNVNSRSDLTAVERLIEGHDG